MAKYHTDSPEYPPENREVHHESEGCYAVRPGLAKGSVPVRRAFEYRYCPP